MTVQDLLHRPARTLISVIGIALEVTFVILVVGLTSGVMAVDTKRIVGSATDTVLNPHSATSMDVLVLVAVTVGFVGTFLSMYRAVLGLTYEIGVLKSLGASKSCIVAIILTETILLCLAGTAAGVGLSYTLRQILRNTYYALPIQIGRSWIIRIGFMAVTGGVLGAVSAAWLASCKDPVEILPYE